MGSGGVGYGVGYGGMVVLYGKVVQYGGMVVLCGLMYGGVWWQVHTQTYNI